MVLLFCFRFFVELIKMPTLLFALNVNWVKRLKAGAASLSFHQESHFLSLTKLAPNKD